MSPHLRRASLSAALVAAGAFLPSGTAAGAPPKSFADMLADVRKEIARHRKTIQDAVADPRKRDTVIVPDILEANLQSMKRLKDACERTGRRLSSEGSLYVDTKGLEARGWRFSDPPAESPPDPVAVRARKRELVAEHTAAGASKPDLVVAFDAFARRSLTASDRAERETHPFAGPDGKEHRVDCSDVKAVLQGHLDTWRAVCAETSSPATPAWKTCGIARWSAGLTGKESADGAPERREWYAWEGQPFLCILSGATFVATVRYPGAAPPDAKLVQEVGELLERVHVVAGSE